LKTTLEQTIGLLFSDDREHRISWKLAFAFGLFVGYCVLLALRIDYYDKMGYEPEMHPGVAFVFLPILFAPLLLISFFVEWLMRRYVGATHNALHTFLVGGTYATFLFWWAFVDHAYLMFIFNPLVLRWAVSVVFQKAQRLVTKNSWGEIQSR
jgi:hypothetical protein